MTCEPHRISLLLVPRQPMDKAGAPWHPETACSSSAGMAGDSQFLHTSLQPWPRWIFGLDFHPWKSPVTPPCCSPCLAKEPGVLLTRSPSAALGCSCCVPGSPAAPALFSLCLTAALCAASQAADHEAGAGNADERLPTLL